MSTAEPRPGCSARRHGDASAYARYNCRCADAREDWRLCRKRGREGRHVPRWVDGAGSARRLQALAALGYGLLDLALYLGWSKSRVQNVQSRKAARVRRVTAEHVERVYAELSMTPGRSERTKRHARRQGWPPPLAWDDDEIDNPDAQPALMPRQVKIQPDPDRIAAALAGDQAARRALRHPDRRQIVRQLHAEGLMDTEIAARSGIPKVTVMRVRGELCLLSNCSRDVRRREGFGKGAA